MKRQIGKVVCVILALIFVCGLFPVSVFAVGSSNPMEDTYVMDDLRTMGIDLGAYGKDAGADYVSVIHFLEYGYDVHGDMRYYGLYLYLYNPSGKPLVRYGNLLQMAYKTLDSNLTSYSKYALDCLSVSVDEGYECLFYKLKLTATGMVGKNIAPAVRQYILSSIELQFNDGTVTDFALNQKWEYNGYQLHFGLKDTDDTLYYNKDVYETIQIDLQSASWFSKTSDLGADYRYEVSSVYFAIPDYFIKQYGDPTNQSSRTHGLYSVQGEYFKYATNGLLVPDRTWYDRFLPLVDKRVSAYYGDDNYAEGYPGFVRYISTGGIYSADLTYNIDSYTLDAAASSSGVYVLTSFQLPYFFNLAVSSGGYLSSDKFLQMYQSSGKNKIYADSVCATDFKLGSNLKNIGRKLSYNISVEDETLNEAIRSYAFSHNSKYNAWFLLDKLFNKELYVDESGYPDIEPLVEIDGSTFSSDALFVMQEDAENIKTYYEENHADNHIYLMRFEVNPYYCPQVSLTTEGKDHPKEEATGYYFEKAVFEKFDILSFTFRDASGGEQVVPVVCTPIDIVGSVTPGNNKVDPNPNDSLGDGSQNGDSPAEDTNWFFVALAIVLGVSVFVLALWGLSKLGVPIVTVLGGIGKIFGFIGKAVLGIFSGIGKAIALIFSLGERRNDKKDKEYERERQTRLDNEESKRKQEFHEHRKKQWKETEEAEVEGLVDSFFKDLEKNKTK